MPTIPVHEKCACMQQICHSLSSFLCFFHSRIQPTSRWSTSLSMSPFFVIHVQFPNWSPPSLPFLTFFGMEIQFPCWPPPSSTSFSEYWALPQQYTSFIFTGWWVFATNWSSLSFTHHSFSSQLCKHSRAWLPSSPSKATHNFPILWFTSWLPPSFAHKINFKWLF